MTKKLLILIGVIIVIGLSGYLFLLFGNQKPQLPTTQEPISKPGIQGTGVSTQPIPGTVNNSDNTLSITTASGENIETKNFKKDPATGEDPINPGYYYLGYHFIEGKGKDIPYTIDYIEKTDYFNIALYQEPIGKSRKEAEQYLMGQLGITQNQMCELRYMVSVPYNVNAFYTSRSLGFSFCPGSVVIPE